ncbi:hypothetical protein ACXET9_07390 [Brachybacterium sp. DNPG3]
MAIPSSAAIIAASRDADLHARMVALGATLDPPLTQVQIEAARTRLAAAPVDPTGTATVASVYEYTASQPRFRPGEDPSGVTDAHIIHALGTIA